MAAAMGLERKAKVAEVALRCAVCALAALAAALVGTGSQTRTFFSLEKKARFTDMKALVLLVAAHGAAAVYSLLQLARCAAAAAWKGGSNGGAAVVAWSVFSCDQAVAYALMAATAAALQSSVVGKRGQPELQWMPVCGLYGAFCRRVGRASPPPSPRASPPCSSPPSPRSTCSASTAAAAAAARAAPAPSPAMARTRGRQG